MRARTGCRSAAASFCVVAVLVTGAAVAGASSGFSFSGGDASITVSWSGSVSGAATLTASAGATAGCSASVSSAGSASCVISGLVNGTSYSVSASVTSNGSTLAASSATVTPYTRPGPVGAVTAEPGDGQATVHWTPGSSGGANVSYTASATSGTTARSCSTSADSCVITGLVNGVTYAVSVTAQNAAGTSTVTGAKVTPRTTPGVVTGLSVSRNARDQPVLTWQAPSDDGGSAVTGYQVLDVGSGGARSVLVTTTDTSVTLTSVGNGAGMTFAVAAQNAAGTGPPSSGVLLGAPAVSRASSVTVRRSGNGSVTVTVHVRDANQIGLGGIKVVIRVRGATSRSWSGTSDARGIVTQRFTGLRGSETFSARAGGVDVGSVSLAFATTSTTSSTTPPTGQTTAPAGGTTVPSTNVTTTTTTTTMRATTTTVVAHEVVHISFSAPAGLRLSRYLVAVTGRGFAVGTRVEVDVRSTPRVLGVVVVGATGTFRLMVRLSSLATGLHHLIVTALQGTTPVARATYAFDVRDGVLTSLGANGLGRYAPYVPGREKGRTLEAALGVLVGLAALRATTRRREVAALEDVELELYGQGEEEPSVEARGWLARASQTAPGRAARVSPVLGRVLHDGEYLRGLVGWGWALLVGVSLAAGLAAATAAHFSLVPGWGWFAAILVLGVLDATLGYVAGLTFVVATLVEGHLAGANDVRLAMGLVLVWFAVPLGAASVAVLRRRVSRRAEDVADRMGDLIVGGLFGAWLAVKMTAALSVLAGADLPLSHGGVGVVVVVLVTLSARMGLETWAARGERLAVMTHRGELDSSKVQVAISLAIQMAAFWFVSAGSLGSSWTLGIGEAVFFSPLVAWLWFDHIPKSAWLSQHAARGVVKWSIVIASGTVLAIVLDRGPASVQLGFVLLPLPILAFWTLELFEEEQALAPALTWRRRVVGLALVGLCAGLVLSA